ncbi:hypothetical protein KP509_16G025400 [Ceratopteris richardii]|uniref:TOG domain-containing protein n=2 Tax=Ceratopteris richardii TaxID=49495 RepID=A0A8T2SZF3_CERRI|nr:hypothetical protein KP509_16G025400 [Ceratopteris richardii]KAH7387491.1 hypothetical protein KP509_16G025400 [Ceratopteris richardii]
MDEVLELLQSKDTKERMAGVERLQDLLEQSRRSLTATEVANLVDASLVLLKDNNFRICQGALQALASASALSSEHLKLHFNVLLPAIVERLGDGKQPVRDAARRLLLALMEISSPTIIVERAGSYAWAHKNWHVREEFARTVASAINLFAATELPFQRLLLPSVLQLLEDPNSNAREAAMICLEEMYRQGGAQLREELQHHSLRPSQLKEIVGRFEKIEPKVTPFDGLANQFGSGDAKAPTYSSSTGNRKNSPKAKPAVPDINLSGDPGDTDGAEKPVDPIRVYSEKELTKEVEKVTAMLAPEQDWSVRITAMQRIEGLVGGGAATYACFPYLLKQLIRPLSIQLADRRSSIVKQACHLLSLLSKELPAEFEPCAEAFIPVLFKLVVITVLVIAESADTCIKTMLRNCRVARVLPRIMESAKNDRNSVLRARCCEYALLVLEQWADSPEIQKLVDMYEDLIKCCVGDAMSEVRSTARTCYRVFAKCWPERCRKLFANFDPAIQRLIIEEEGGLHKRYASPSLRDLNTHQMKHSTIGAGTQSASAGSQLVSFGATPIVAMDRTGSMITNSKAAPERSLESVLHASQQQVNAIETMLKGMDIVEKTDLSTRSNRKEQGADLMSTGSYKKIYASNVATRVGVDPPSARDPPLPAATPAIQGIIKSSLAGGSPSNLRGVQVGNSVLSSAATLANIHGSSSSEYAKMAYSSGNTRDVNSSLLPLYSVKRVPVSSDRSSQGSSNDDIEPKAVRRHNKIESHVDKYLIDGSNRDLYQKDSSHSSIPGFQRPLLRNSGSVRSSLSSRSSFDDSHLPFGDPYNYMDGLMSLNDALTEGLSSGADWSAKVSAFSYLKKLLKQGPRGFQDVIQSFEKVMKLFSQHLDDPHHKVAQAALSTLAELVPACRKPFEAYLERILPHVFSRLVDPKEFIRQLGTSVLETVGNHYSIDHLLPALLRSLDEQRSPKTKMAVIEFAIAAFAKLAVNGEAPAGNNLLKMWLAKLAPLANDKNAKLKETAVNGIISVYTHFDSSTVLNFILGLSIEEQSILRRALKQHTSRIEVELMSFLQNRSQRTRSKPSNDPGDLSPTLDDSYGLSAGRPSLKNQTVGSYSASFNSDGSRKWSSSAEPVQYGSRLSNQSSFPDMHGIYQSYETSAALPESLGSSRSRGSRNGLDESPEGSKAWLERPSSNSHPSLETKQDLESTASSHADSRNYQGNGHSASSSMEMKISSNRQPEIDQTLTKSQAKPPKKQSSEEIASNIPNLLNQLSASNDENALEKKRAALQNFLYLSKANQTTIWSQYLNQILTGLLEAVDDSDPSVRELSLSTILEMLGNQKDMLDDSVEVMLEKLLHCTRDLVAKVSSVADRCLSLVLSQYDPYRCLSVVVPLLNSEDEKTLVTCISCLTKLVGRLPSEDLMAQLPSFLPALFDAFGNQSADVRKTVVFCLVDIYIVLGKAFLPYLGSLSSTQLRLVTIYANRISQARSGTPLDSAT